MTALHIQAVTVRYIFCNVPAMVHKADPHASAVNLFTFCVAFPAKATCKAPHLYHPSYTRNHILFYIAIISPLHSRVNNYFIFV